MDSGKTGESEEEMEKGEEGARREGKDHIKQGKAEEGRDPDQDGEVSHRTPIEPRAALKIVLQGTIEEISDVDQALKRGRGSPQKKEEHMERDCRRSISPGPGKGSVPNMGVGHCLGPEGNGVSLGEKDERGPGPPEHRGDEQSTLSKEGGNMEKEEEGRRRRA
jgi:hypothetical protein